MYLIVIQLACVRAVHTYIYIYHTSTSYICIYMIEKDLYC